MISIFKNNWFYRQLFTYLPIFFIISSTLIFFIFLSTSQIIKGEVTKADGVYLQHAIQSIDYALETINQQMIKEVLTNNHMKNFASLSEYENLPLVNYQLANDLRELTLLNPLIDSVYFYRIFDQFILTTNQLVSIDTFNDREFLLNLNGNRPPYNWFGVRNYKEFQNQQEPVQVVSLVRSLSNEHQGYLVVNVKTDAIKKMIDNMSTSQITFIDIYDQAGKLLWGDLNGAAHLSKQEMSNIQSTYTNWTYLSGLKGDNVFGVASSIISYMWMAGGLFIAILGGLLIFYVIRWNYKPVEALIKQSSGFLKQYQENLIYRKSHFFRKLMSENHKISEAEWNFEVEKLGLSNEFEQLSVAIIEIDNYYEFKNKYSNKDQYLLTFILSNVLLEISQKNSINVWSEWLEKHQLSVLFQISENNINAQEIIFALCEQMRIWVERNLKFTVTIGIGNATKQISMVPHAYHESLDSTKYKTALGNNRIIGFWEISAKAYTESFRHLHFIRTMSQHLRLGEPEWEGPYRQFMNELKHGFLSRDEVISQLHYLIYYLYKDIMELSVDFQDIWKHAALPQLNKLVDRFDLIEEVEEEFFDILVRAKAEMDLLRDSKKNHFQIQKVRMYIEEHYANQEISLNSLSDEFGISPKYLSRLFKDEFGVNFVDYLVSVRVKNAKKLLCETTDSIQDIAVRVGYVHSLSFIRVFKKIVGLTPGDYRKETTNQL
ncbi:AraC family transcriptional regulator [Paenibacillus agricola]|uniref:Helix-turn-helix transcriptional regulator n=1 Tax=Paenibacillus agricola TaxID=2716264 RepID=A0ABX0JCB3_9BACL|nr:helix-turn-helix domain-containing protein [Paenibacillus agricola]NHN34145.1 helix-turn-helix transcriptional regulator [Paenibacillus agricola]